MMVTFVSQCEKKALNKTRRVLDAFANRIGDNTWQTVITNEGLNAVKKLLRKTASKNTAVACHWARSRSRSELVWVVGNRVKFDNQGNVPVNRTKRSILRSQWESDWHYLPLIQALTALAALFHDWGKASRLFQAKLDPANQTPFKADPLRHEWVSCLLLNSFINAGKYPESDSHWLERLSQGDVETASMNTKNTRPLANLPPLASMVAWLVISHHRLPLPRESNQQKQYRGFPLAQYSDLFGEISPGFGYENRYDEADHKARVEQCFEFPNGLPNQSAPWLKQIKKWATKTTKQLPLMEQSLSDGSWRLVLHHARLSLMLGDHFYSSQGSDAQWRSDLDLYANTDRETRQLKQKLDEHLVGVARNAIRTAYLLPAFETEPPKAEDIRNLKKKSPPPFSWQDKAVSKINSWRKQEANNDGRRQFGLFAVNMASTGCGKTIANAKIMQALSPDGKSLRYILALGLRTLTLQTGDVYKDQIGLDETELAVLIGSKAVLELHKDNKQSQHQELTPENSGSQSLERLLIEDIDYDCAIPEEGFTTVLTCDKDKQFLYAPVLACTIDHIMSATETTRGGRYILPCLRLMSSDLVIDEIDDFDGDDLIAIGRLIHLAGMLGRKIMISSATIPPALAEGYFHAYQQGWLLFAQSRGASKKVGSIWIDENTTHIETINLSTKAVNAQYFSAYHDNFIHKRVKYLKKQPVKRRANIKPIEIAAERNIHSLQETYFSAVQQAIVENHQSHHQVDIANTHKKVSFGVMRVANISPCVDLFEYLLATQWPENVAVRVMAYHSQQVMLMRSAQEKHLDEVLNRKEANTVFEHPLIRQQLENTNEENVIYILVATPVEEIGRDHDFDWAVVEPSSYRSIIQLAGRVVRHRQNPPSETENVILLQYNLKGFKQTQNLETDSNIMPVYCRPGYESSDFLLDTHNLEALVDPASLEQSLTAIPRIQSNKHLQPKRNLADLEHVVISSLLTNYSAKGPESLEGWLTQYWWLTGLPQTLVKFRKSAKNINLYLIPDNPEEEDMNFVFMEKDDRGHPSKAEEIQGISHTTQSVEKQRLWLERDYQNLLVDVAERFDISIRMAALKFGEISIPQYKNSSIKYTYSPYRGLVKDN